MVKIVKNPGIISKLKGEKYVLKAYSDDIGETMYAKIRLKPIIWYFVNKLKNKD